jgi:hypothetical protein
VDSAHPALFLYYDRNFVPCFQSWYPACRYDNVSPFARRREAANLARLVHEFVEIQSEFFGSYRDDDLNINPVIVARFFLDVGRDSEGSFHILDSVCDMDAADWTF